MTKVHIKFEDFMTTLTKAIRNASSNDKIEIAFCLNPDNEFTVIDGNKRMTWVMEMPPRMSDPTWTLYALLTRIIDFGDNVYTVFDKALRGSKQGWVMLILTGDGVRADHRNKL